MFYCKVILEGPVSFQILDFKNTSNSELTENIEPFWASDKNNPFLQSMAWGNTVA